MDLRRTHIEEILSVLYAIAALLAFQFDHPYLGWYFTAHAVLDLIHSIRFAWQDLKEGKR